MIEKNVWVMKDIRALVKEVRGGFFQVFEAVYREIGGEESVLLSWMFNWADNDNELDGEDGFTRWRRWRVKYVEDRLGLKERKQQRLLRKLVDLGMIEIEHKHHKDQRGSYRRVRVNVDGVIAILMKSTPAKDHPSKVTGHRPDKSVGSIQPQLNKHNPRRSDSEGEMGKGFGFLDDKTKGTTDFDKDIANQILKTLVRHKYKPKRATNKKWDQAIRLLREEDKIPTEVIKAVVDYWSRNIKTDFIPAVRSATGFRKCFQRIIDHADRRGIALVEIEIDDEVASILDELYRRKTDWPSSFEQVVAKSEVEVHNFFCDLDDLRATSTESRGRVEYIVHDIGRPHTLIVQHFTKVARRLDKWDEFDGNMNMFKITRDHLREQVTKSLRRYGDRNPEEFLDRMDAIADEAQTSQR